MTCAAAAMRAAWMQHKPTAPAPITTTELPRSTRAAFTTEPYPVITQQPNVQAVVKGISRAGSMRITAACGTTVAVDIVPRPKLVAIGRPRCRNRSGGTVGLLSQALGRPLRQEQHSAQGIAQLSRGRS